MKTCDTVGSMNTNRSIRDKERERRGSSLPGASATSDGGRNRAAALGVRGARAQRWASGCEREEKRGMSELYTARERGKGKQKGDNRPAALPLVAGEQSGANEQERGKRQETVEA
jgi:hypothetical protein